MTDGEPNFVDHVHALRAGMLWGALMKAGLNVYPEIDDDGDYMNVLNVELDMGGEKPVVVQIATLP